MSTWWQHSVRVLQCIEVTWSESNIRLSFSRFPWSHTLQWTFPRPHPKGIWHLALLLKWDSLPLSKKNAKRVIWSLLLSSSITERTCLYWKATVAKGLAFMFLQQPKKKKMNCSPQQDTLEPIQASWVESKSITRCGNNNQSCFHYNASLKND